MYGRRMMSWRVDFMRWLGVIQLILGLLIFIILVVMASIDMEDYLDAFTSANDEEDEGRPFTFLPVLRSFGIVFLGVPVAGIAVATGVSGSVLSRYEGLQYNLAARHVLLALSTLNGFFAMSYLVFAGMITFDFADAGFLSSDDDSVVGILALQIVNFVLVFFDFVMAFVCVTVCACWNPPSSDSTPVVTERVVEEKPKSRDYYRHRDVYSDSPYYSRSRTLPLKYY